MYIIIASGRRLEFLLEFRIQVSESLFLVLPSSIVLWIVA